MKLKTCTAILALLIGVTSASADVIDISAIINTTQEIPAPTGVPTGAGGFAALQYDDSTRELSWDIAWQDLSSPAVGMHFHAPAAAGATSGVAVNIGNISGLTSPSVGSVVIDDAFAASLLAGESYINIHTEQNGPGEIRGQVNPGNINLTASLDTTQEIPAPTGVPMDAGGSAHIAYDPSTGMLGWNIAWDNLSGPAVGMHFHGPADPGSNAGVSVNIGDISGLASPSIGSTMISSEQAEELLAGQWYINIHTEANGPGEIRGQVVPEPATTSTLLLGVLACLGGVRRRRGN